MLQLNHLAINLLASVVAVWGATGVLVAASAEESAEPTFANFCGEFQGVSGNWNSGLYSRPYAWQTTTGHSRFSSHC